MAEKRKQWERTKADLAAFGRGGLIDLQNAVVHAFPDSQRQAEVIGQPGRPPSQEVFDERNDYQQHREQAQQPAKETEKGKEPERE